MRNRTHTTCTVLRHNDQFCDAPSADDMPFPICARHAAKLYRHVREQIVPLASDPAFALWHNLGEIQRQRDAKQTADQAKQHVVYYLQIGPHLKIGYTGNLKQRLRDYPITRRLLAYEPGGEQLEAERHREFGEYLDVGNEWFKPGPKLIDHVNRLRATAGAPAIRRFT